MKAAHARQVEGRTIVGYLDLRHAAGLRQPVLILDNGGELHFDVESGAAGEGVRMVYQPPLGRARRRAGR